MQSGLVERVGRPGERSRFYRLKSGGFTEILRAEMRFTSESRMLAEQGLALLGDAPTQTRRHLQEYRDLCAFFEREFPALIDNLSVTRINHVEDGLLRSRAGVWQVQGVNMPCRWIR